jgi:hypothetical protein
MTNLARQDAIANLSAPMVRPGNLTIPKGTTAKTVYVRFTDNESQFSFSKKGTYYSGGIAWSYYKNVKHPKPLVITFMFSSDIKKLTNPSANLTLGSWTPGATQQTCTVAAVAAPATSPDTFTVVTQDSRTHDPQIVVTPQ